MSLRRKSRELAMQAMYQSELTGQSLIEAFLIQLESFEVNKKAVTYARELLAGISGRLEEIDQLIGEQSKHWRLERMAQVDRNILRIAVYELSVMVDIPGSVVINEAIEIANRYSNEDAASFINGILDAIGKKLGRI
ncbi:MAG: transcription antitermination factor NusB [Proteobacteria bacterium]|nr:transcription antitermination factor NusB [Pseudomonadota bacterium]MBU1688905.1 transcription antitermination factor NusB [Pseudomonadota bacterium]